MPMKSICSSLILLTFIGLAGSCAESELRVAQGVPYTLKGTVWQDSTTTDSTVTLIIDRHEQTVTLHGDTLPAYEVRSLEVEEGQFSYVGHVPMDADELYLYDQHGHDVRLYGTSGAQLLVDIDRNGRVTASSQKTDTTDLLRVIQLRDSILSIHDSLLVRRRLGGLPAEAKPRWLMQSIDELLDRQSQQMSRKVRLPKVRLETADTTLTLPNSRPESLLLLFWSDQDSASIDSLQVLRAVARDYGLYGFASTFMKEKSPTRSKKFHRIELFSLCVHATDSASWRRTVKGLPGHHACLEGGLAHPLATELKVDRLPAIVLLDRFGNYQIHNAWGPQLYQQLEKTPIHTDRVKKYKIN